MDRKKTLWQIVLLITLLSVSIVLADINLNRTANIAPTTQQVTSGIYNTITGAWGSFVNSTLQNVNVTVSMEDVKFHVYTENIAIVTSGGSGSGQSLNHGDFVITKVIYTPSNSSTRYNSEVYEFKSGDTVDKNRIQHTGEWGIYKYHAIVNDSVVVNIIGSIPDDTYNVEITYEKSGAP